MSAKQQRIRIGIIGAGSNTRGRHIPGFRKIPGVEIVVVCNRSRESSQKAADEFGIPRIADRWEDVTRDPEVDAVMIGTWPYLHAEGTIASLENGKHVLTEARMASNLEEAERMLDASRKHPDLVTQIVPAPMSLDVDETVMELVRLGELGDLREVVVTNTGGGYADSSKPMTWRLDHDLSGINILGLGIMHEMIVRWIDDDPEWVSADAEVFTKRRFDREKGEEREVEIPECVSIIGRFRSGARLAYHLSGVQSVEGRAEMVLNGSKACLRFDMRTGELSRASVEDGKDETIEIPEAKKRGWRVEEDFIDSIRQGTPVRLTSFEDGVRYMRFLDAVWESWKEGRGKSTK